MEIQDIHPRPEKRKSSDRLGKAAEKALNEEKVVCPHCKQADRLMVGAIVAVGGQAAVGVSCFKTPICPAFECYIEDFFKYL